MTMDANAKVLERYNAKVFKNRKDHMLQVNHAEEQQISANTRSVPGIMTNRGCCYAGCKGVVLGPIKDMVLITHGPVGCGFYSWGTRRNKARAEGDDPNFIQYCFTTDMQESDIVFGGVKKLKQAIAEVMQLMQPKTIMIAATCPVGLIGDDIQSVATEAEQEYGIRCVAYSCEGYKGVSQSAGHHIANNGLMKRVIGTGDIEPATKYSVNILGEYNIGGDGWEQERILKKIGYEVLSVFTGDGAIERIASSHKANLNLVQCHRSINYIAEMMKTKYGVDWLKVNFIGLEGTVESLRHMAAYFGDPALIQRTEEVIAEELGEISDAMAACKARLQGKTAALFVGGSRSHHYQGLLKDIGISTVLAGYEFGHRDDYEGREVIPTIKDDADSKNIESITVEKDEKKYHAYLSQEQYEKLAATIPLEQYSGMIRDMDNGSYVVDDLNMYEADTFVELLKPDMFFSGIKDKYALQKAGALSRQLHCYDYSGPYAGFRGAVRFAQDVCMGYFTPAWHMVLPPWKTSATLQGTVGE